VVEDDTESALDAFSHIQAAIRAIYSSPPAHGGKIVATILGQPELKALWMRELADMRTRIKSMRQAFVTGMADRNTGVDFEFINHQQGMFSFSGLTKAQVEKLRADNHIYIVGFGPNQCRRHHACQSRSPL